MAADVTSLSRQYLALLSAQPFVERELDYRVLERHIPFLDQLDRVGNAAISVFDLFRMRHAYVSPRYRERLGILEPSDEPLVEGSLDPLIHPDDFPRVLESGYYFFQIALALPPEERRDFKLLHEYRLRRSAGEWMRVCEQYLLLENDPAGNIWLSLSIVDVSPAQEVDRPFRGHLLNLRTAEVYSFPPAEAPAPGPLSGREKEVLALLAGGKVSKEVADALYLSIHTVNTHRQNILRKLKVQNTAEAIRYAADLGLI